MLRVNIGGTMIIGLIRAYLFTILSVMAAPNDLLVIGYVPNEYVPGSRDDSGVTLSKVSVLGGVIESITPISEEAARQALQQAKIPAIALRKSESSDFDVLYPGLINLHNHTKQNVLPLWDNARGQFANRFEWRDWDDYSKAVSGNISPWAGMNDPWGPIPPCALFRWSELEALTLGTTYLQGPSSCIENFAIHQVEDAGAYLVDRGTKPKKGVQAPTDLVFPEDFGFVWNELRPRMQRATHTQDWEAALAKGATYEEALRDSINENCSKLVAKHPIKDVNGEKELKILGNKELLTELCDIDGLPDHFIRYVQYRHPSIAGRKRYLLSSDKAGVIAHLGEGRRNDPYNKLEFPILRLLGLDQRGVNLVHAVGVDAKGFEYMAKQGMGLIWSPFSNLLLYGETVDISAAAKANKGTLLISLGSDWTPTGSKSVLEELKIAKTYVEREKLTGLISDKKLVKMVTENPARMIGHFENEPGDGQHGIGTLVPDSAASFIAVARKSDDPYTNLVSAEAGDIRLVVVDGNPIYGNLSYLKRLDPKKAAQAEILPSSLDIVAGTLKPGRDVPAPVVPSKSLEKDDARALTDAHLVALAKAANLERYSAKDLCGFDEPKVLMPQDSGDSDIAEFRKQSGLDLERFEDIQRFLAVLLMTQGKNAGGLEGGDKDFVVGYFPPLYSCADTKYQTRFSAFISADGKDEVAENVRLRAERRAPFGRGPARLAGEFDQAYDPRRDY